MADGSKIEWTDATWNPVTGCSVLSAGCSNCYAMRLAGGRMQHHPSRAGLTRPTKAGPVWTGEVRWNEQWLDQPLQWRRPRRVFVAAHADLFHDGVTDEQLAAVFAIMAACPQHQFQVLTKRPKRAWEWFRKVGQSMQGDALETRLFDLARAAGDGRTPAWPLPNVWLGISVENQEALDERILHLLSTPAAVRWVSYEPALGPVDFTVTRYAPTDKAFQRPAKLDWIVAGGESGPGARPSNPQWFRDVRDWCLAEGVAFLFKQWGAWGDGDSIETTGKALNGWWENDPEDGGVPVKSWPHNITGLLDVVGSPTVHLVGKVAAGRHLDGRTWDEYPGQVAP